MTIASQRKNRENSQPRRIPTVPARGIGIKPTILGVIVWIVEAITGRMAAVTSRAAPTRSPNRGVFSSVSRIKMNGIIVRTISCMDLIPL
jgi:hypothetical protein